MSGAAGVRIDHARFGSIEVPEAEVLHFGGIPGFPDADRFALLGHDGESVFHWLVSLDDPELALAVTDPRAFFPDYRPALDERVRGWVEAGPGDELVLLAVATVREGRATLNLAAPLVVNPRARRGVQAVIVDADVSPRAPIGAPAGSGGPAAASPRTDGERAQIESKPQT